MDDSPAQRQSRIMALTRERGAVSTAELGELLDLPAAALRRDLRKLEAEGSVRRGYGMVYPVETTRYETSLALREASDSDERRRIARATAEIVDDWLDDNSTLFIDEGRTTLLAAAHLRCDRRLTIVTPSLPAAVELASTADHEILLLGGRVRARTLGTVDYWARDMLSGFAIDVAMLGSNGISQQQGLTTPDPAVSAIKSMAVRVSRKRIVAAEHTKFGVHSFARFATMSDIETFVTGERLSPSLARSIVHHGAGLRLV
ncbi:DeoR/GlpR family DNA-binding transcription regulator [Microbacterium gubbeenense]|uniref:DeoR/GlpR family DNA-binding transcription regulator n=2 Tax=Microbacterium gubbeenense TaxID=159896 RepID=UPI003F946B44